MTRNAEKIKATLLLPYTIAIGNDGAVDATAEHLCTVSMGVVLFLDKNIEQNAILRLADTARRKNTMTKTTHSDDESITTTLHPFEGLPNGEERFAKAQLANQINLLIEERGLKQREAAELLGITPPDVSNLATGRLSGFTFDRLCRYLSALDTDVEIILKKHAPTDMTLACIHVSYI